MSSDPSHYQDTLKFHAHAAKQKDGYYDSKPDEEGQRHHSRWQLRARDLMLQGIHDIARETPVKSLLDVGCGRGDFSDELGKRFGDASILGVDFSADMIGIANRSARPNVEFSVASLPELDLAEKKFDIAVCLNVLHHVLEEDQPVALTNMCKRAQRGIVVEMKNSACPYKKLKRGLRLSDGTRVYPTTAKRIIETMKAAGFTLLKKRPIFFVDLLSPIIVLSFLSGEQA